MEPGTITLFLRRLVFGEELLGLLLLIVIGAGGTLTWLGYQKIQFLSGRVDALSFELASTTLALEGSIENASSTLSTALSSAQQNVSSVEQQLGGFQNQVGSFTNTLDTIQKLSQIDPQLLAKYSLVYFLNENYAPARLSEIPSQYEYWSTKHNEVIPEISPFLTNMLASASSTGVALYVDSAYRSFDDQKALKDAYTVTYGAGTANTFSAEQGYSEHQLGTAIDFITTGLGGQLSGFDKTAAYTWLVNNAYKYGFILSYPKGNSYYIYEPWHWRFVGIKLATDLHNQGKYFYDLDQRTIDNYLINLFDPN